MKGLGSCLTFLLIFVAIDAEEELLLASKESRLKNGGSIERTGG